MFEINPFVLQVIISNVPSVLTSGFFPILGSSFGASVVNIGLFFFLLRIGSVIGSLVSPNINNKYEPHKIGTASEILFSLTTFLILISVITKNIELFIICAFLKGIIGGVLSILRFTWLKQLPDFQKSSRLNLLANVFILTLIFLPSVSSTSLKIILFSLIFFCYPLINLQVQSEWFKICLKNEAAGISSAEMIYSQVIFGIFEIIYSVLRLENIYRASFLLCAFFLIVFYSFSRKAEEKEFVAP